MDVILHIGAHRTASTSFQTYLRRSAPVLAEHGIGFWGPLRLRRGPFHGIIPNPQLGVGTVAFARAQGRIGLHLDRAARNGTAQLIVSDENMLGQMRENIARASLYPAAGERLARFTAAFRGSARAIYLSIRDLSHYWPSALSFAIPRGVRVPGPRTVQALADQPRDWRDVITDLAAAAPEIPIFVSTYERHADAPARVLQALTGQLLPDPPRPIRRNERPSTQHLLQLPLSDLEIARLHARNLAGRWTPFDSAQIAALNERYADDLFWLRAGADGLAHFMEDPKTAETGSPAGLRFANRGQSYDTRQRLAGPG